MLVLSRKVGEQIRIGDSIHVSILAVKGNQVRLGLSAPANVPILRVELVLPPDKLNDRPSLSKKRIP
jgi:carbon storage regulator